MARSSHVPKFGNWDGDNVPITAFFESARKERSAGVRINPNDPEQNPDAFNHNHLHQRNISDDLFSDRIPSENSANYVPNPSPLHRSKYASHSSVPPSPSPSPNKPADDFAGRPVSVPKFGAWDEKDPGSAEGFTVIFNKVKEEKQMASAKCPPPPTPLPPPQSSNVYDQSSWNKERRTRRCCCLF